MELPFSLPTLPSLLSLLIPITYLTILVGSLATFSTLYRRRQTNSKLRLAPYFPPHIARNIYLTLLHQSDTQADLKTVPTSILCAALQERACEDILRIREIQTRKGPLNTLLQRGIVGDDIWQRLLRAEQELEAEIKDVVSEANALANGWGATILQTANEIIVNRMTKEKLDEKRRTLQEEKDAWDKVREQSRLELEGGLTDEKKEDKEKRGSLSATTTQSTPEKEKNKPKTAAVTEGSDEEAVMVEKDANASEAAAATATPGSGGPGSGKSKKKKNKK